MARLNNGQSLMELIIAVGLGVSIILGGIGAVSLYLRVSSQDIPYQKANFLVREIIDEISVTAGGNWEKIANATSSSYLSASSSGFIVQTGQENKTLDNTNYSRYFYASSVCRDASDNIVDCSAPGSINDPSTKKITTIVEWVYRGSSTNVSLEKYITKTSNEVLFQNNWVGGKTCATSSDPIVSGYTTSFCSSTPSLDFDSNPGIIKIGGY